MTEALPFSESSSATPCWPWLPIVMLHRVTEVTPQPNPYNLCRSQDELDLIVRTLLHRGRRIVTLGEAVAALDRREEVSHLACLTFDDGYRDFFTHAWPVLKHHGVPATVFLVADRIGGWNTWDANTKGLDQVPLMDLDQIHQLIGDGCEFGSHSATHPHLSSLPPRQRDPEILGARRTLENLIEREVPLFAYPHNDQDEEAQRQLADADFIAAVGGEQANNTRFNLHRVHPSRMDTLSLRFRLGGWHYRAQRSPAMGVVRSLKRA